MTLVAIVPPHWYHVSIAFKWYVVNTHLYGKPMKPAQIRMARAALGWGVRELAKRAGVTANTVTRIENGADAKQSTIDALRTVIEAAGLELIPPNGGGPGVRFRNNPS